MVLGSSPVAVTYYYFVLASIKYFWITKALRENCPNTELWPVFSVVGLNSEIYYGVNLRIQPEYGKIRTRKNSILVTLHAVSNKKSKIVQKFVNV